MGIAGLKHAWSLVATVVVIVLLGGLAFLASSDVGERASSLQESNATRLSKSVADFVNALQVSSQASLKAMEPPGTRWALQPGDPNSRLALESMLPTATKRAAVALIDETGRRFAESGNPSLVPLLDSRSMRTLLIGLNMSGMGVATFRSGQGAVVGLAVRSRSNARAIIAYFQLDQPSVTDTYLSQMAQGRGAFVLLDASGVVRWSSKAALRGQVPAWAAPRSVPGSPAVLHKDSGFVQVDAPVGVTGLRLIFRQDRAGFYGGVESQNMLARLVLIVLMVLSAVALIASWHWRQKSADLGVRRLHNLMTNVNDTVLVVDGGIVTYASEAVEELLGSPADQAQGRMLRGLIGPEAAEAVSNAVGTSTGEERTITLGDVRCTTDAGQTLWAEVTVADRREDTSVGGVIVALHDITRRRAAADALLHDATHDGLTGLINRAHFLELAERTLQRSRRDGSRFAVLYLDLDDFKPVNDVYGHPTGDLVLQECARRLARCIRPGDVVARWGGDEFTVLLDPVQHDSEAEQVADRIRDAIAAPIVTSAGDISAVTRVRASIGLVIGGRTSESVATLLREADAAMYDAKETGRHRWSVGDPLGQVPVPRQSTRADNVLP